MNTEDLRGVYRCGFSTSQAPYEAAFWELFGALDRVEGILSQQRYLGIDVHMSMQRRTDDFRCTGWWDNCWTGL